MIIFGFAAMACGLAGSKTDHGSVYFAITIKSQGSTEHSGFVVRMGSNGEHSKHGVILAESAERV